MDITRFFIHFRKPSQYIYGGEKYLEIYRCEKRADKRVTIFENASLLNLGSDDVDEIKRELQDVETGIILNSGQFIFNIFEFEKIPFREEVRKDLVEWRLQKVFPEDIDQYEHNYYKLARNRILSVLFKKSLKEKLEELFWENGVRLIYMGNSTMEIMNNIRRLRPCPDFFIEIDKSLTMIVFLSGSNPFYIRKFRSSRNADIAAEVIKTVNFVKNSYSRVPRTYLLLVNSAEGGFDLIREQLTDAELNEVNPKNQKKLFLPG